MTCWRRLVSVTSVRGEDALGLQREVELLGLGHVPERPVDVVQELVQPQLADVDHDRAGLDLREVQDVVDQREEVLAGGVDRLGELGLLAGQVPIGVSRELVRQDQEAVERRPELVRHVRQELRLVLRGERQLPRLLLEREAGLLDLLVLALDVDVALRQERRLLLELLVGLPQLLLLGLELAGEGLRLLQQVLGARVALDGLEHDADRLRQLVEQRLVRGAEAA